MIAKFKRKVRNYIIRSFVNILPEIKEKYELTKIEVLSKNLFKVGSNFSIQYPYLISGAEYISIGNNFRALQNCRFQVFRDTEINTDSQLLIGNDVSFESNCHVGVVNKIIIEDGVMIASNVFISDHFHGSICREDFNDIPNKRKLSSKGPIIIHKNVWIGDSVCILSGVVIGENAIIGANAVVTRDIPANSVVAGVPAVVIKQF